MATAPSTVAAEPPPDNLAGERSRPNPDATDVPKESELIGLPAAPAQGSWTVEQWESLDIEGPRIELVDGCLELHAVPRLKHHMLQAILADQLRRRFGVLRTLENGAKVRLGTRNGRIPDILVLRPEVAMQPDAESLDASAVLLAVEVLSPGRRQQDRDRVEKRADYAAAGIDEYWLVDPVAETVTPYRLVDGHYPDADPLGRTETLIAVVDEELRIDLDELFASLPTSGESQ